jgi:hypothetical protein
MKMTISTFHPSSGKTLRIFFQVFAWLITSNGFAQDTTALLKEKFQNYQQNALTEKLFVHTDRNFYLTGETIFSKIYSVDGLFNKPLDVNQVAYVEILDAENQPVIQTKIKLDDGLGNGATDIPLNIKTGNYKLVAYTSWMRNFDQQYFFEKDISIFNALVESEQKAASGTSESKVQAQFFPEGGNLVDGLKSKIAFQVTDATGAGIAFNGAIINQNNDTLARFTPHIFGIGNFLLTASKGNKYTAVIRTANGTTVHDLPPVFDQGFVMSLEGQGSATLKISVATNKSGQAEKPVYLFIHTRGGLLTALKQVVSSSGEASFNLESNQLGDGISHLTIFDKSLKPVCERLYFKQPENILNVTAGTNKSVYQKRENVNLGVQTLNEVSAPVPASLSLSVYKVDELQPTEEVNIVNYLLMSSDLGGKIESPGYYLNSSDKAAIVAVDNLMLTHGWRRFRWEDVERSSYPVIHFNPDVEGVTVRAKVTDSLGNALSGANAFMSVVSKQLQFYPGMTNTRGIVQFYTSDFFGKNEIVVQPFGKSMRYQVTLLSPFADSHKRSASIALNVPATATDLLTSYSIHAQVQRAFQAEIKLPRAVVDSMSFFGTPDKVYRLSDYTRFPTMGEVLKEYVPEVIVRRKNKKAQLFILDKTRQVFFENEPLILIDGVPIFDTDLIVSLSATQIKKIELLNEKFFYGPFILNGIISFKTVDGDLGGFKLPREAFVFDYEGLQLNKEFYHPQYNTSKSDRTPDFRNVLLWQPTVKTNTNGKSEITFPTSDVKGKFIGVLQGISPNGLVGSKTFTFEVRDANQ